MMLHTADEIERFLESNRAFVDCLLVDVRWQHYGTIVDLVFDYIWEENGAVRADDLAPVLKTLRLHVVQELRLLNDLSAEMTVRPGEYDWGLSEVAIVRLPNDRDLIDKYCQLPVPFHHLQCAWESDRRLDVVFSRLEVVTV